MKILIVEDEFVIAEDLRAALISSGYKVFGIARTYDQAINLLKKDRPDFALVDITLQKDQSGLELGRLFAFDMKIPYVYVTSHSDIATLEKVKLTNPTGFLLKPFKRESIFTAIEVAKASFAAANETDDYLTLKKGEEKIRIRLTEILFIESDGNYIHIQTPSLRFTERKILKEFLDELRDHPFVRVHKSFAVNKNKIQNYTREKITIAAYEIPVGRAYLNELNNTLSKS